MPSSTFNNNAAHTPAADSPGPFTAALRDLSRIFFTPPATPEIIERARSDARFDSTFARRVHRLGIKDQQVLVELAMIAAEHEPVYTAANFKNFRIESEADRAAIATLLASKAGGPAAKWLRNFGLKGEEHLIAVAHAAARNNGHELAEHFRSFGIRSEAERIALALRAASSGSPAAPFSGPSQFIRNFDITIPEALFNIALTAAKHSGAAVARDIHHYRITDPAKLEQVALEAVKSGGTYAAQHIRNFGLTNQETLMEIGRRLTSHRIYGSSEHIDLLGISSDTDRAELARWAAKVPSSDIAKYIGKYGITDQAALAEIAELALRSDVVRTIEHFSEFKLAAEPVRRRLAYLAAERAPELLAASFRQFQVTDQSCAIEFARRCLSVRPFVTLEHLSEFGIRDPEALLSIRIEGLQRAPLRNLPALLRDPSLSREELNSRAIAPAFRELGRTLTNPDAEAIKRFRNLTETIKGVAAGSELARFAGETLDFAALEPHERFAIITRFLRRHVPQYDDSLLQFEEDLRAEEIVPAALAGIIAGWESYDPTRFETRSRAALARISGYDDLPAGKLSANAERELWGVILTAQELLDGPVGSRLPVSFDNRALALRFITTGAALVGLGGALPEYPGRITGKDHIEQELKLLQIRLEQQFAQALGLDSLPNGSLERLMSEWGGDITPFIVLAARFRKEPSWQGELPVLAKIATDVLAGDFHRQRYSAADGQLAMLDRRQLQRWQQNDSELKLHVVSEEGAAAATSPRENVKAAFEMNLLRHLPAEIAAEVPHRSLNDVARFIALSERARAREDITLAQAVGLIRVALERGTEEELKQTITGINGIKNQFLRDLTARDSTLARQISDDLNTLKELLRSRKGATGQSYYVFSTLDDHPMTLMKTGDLVQAASCQNYRSGRFIGTLPGYVIDGNIKLALSWVIKPQQLDTALREVGLKPGDPFTHHFDSARQELIIAPVKREGDTLVRTSALRLGYAMRREVLRLGESGGKPVVLTEQPYLQPHPIEPQLIAQQDQLIATFRQSIGAVRPPTETETHFPASRNPGGVYSDKCGGTKRGRYSYRPRPGS